jgi:hypothetical protein
MDALWASIANETALESQSPLYRDAIGRELLLWVHGQIEAAQAALLL